MRREGNWLLDILFPPRCVGCGFFTATGEWWCEQCETLTTVAPRRVTVGAHELFFARFYTAPPVAYAIANLKYQGAYMAAIDLIEWWRPAWTAVQAAFPGEKILVPVPLHPRRQAERGFNQAELLARQWGEVMGIKVLDCVQRVRYTTPQAQSARGARFLQMQGAFRVNDLLSETVCYVLVDDVCTTGATLNAAAAALAAAGAQQIIFLTLAHA